MVRQNLDMTGLKALFSQKNQKYHKFRAAILYTLYIRTKSMFRYTLFFKISQTSKSYGIYSKKGVEPLIWLTFEYHKVLWYFYGIFLRNRQTPRESKAQVIIKKQKNTIKPYGIVWYFWTIFDFRISKV